MTRPSSWQFWEDHSVTATYAWTSPGRPANCPCDCLHAVVAPYLFRDTRKGHLPFVSNRDGLRRQRLLSASNPTRAGAHRRRKRRRGEGCERWFIERRDIHRAVNAWHLLSLGGNSRRCPPGRNW